MAWFSKFELLFAIKKFFSGNQCFKDISNFGYFKKLEKVRKKLHWLSKLAAEMRQKKCSAWKKNAPEWRLGGWMDGRMGVIAVLRNAYDNQNMYDAI